MDREPIVQNFEDDEVEIDLLEVLNALRKKILWIILAAVLGGGLSFAFSYFVMTPQYTSTALMFVLSKETTLTSLADLQIGSQLTKDYQVIVTSRTVLNEVIQELRLDTDYEELQERITVENPENTRILSISAEDPDPRTAKAIVDAVARTSSDYIGDIMEMVPPKMIEAGVVPREKSSPNSVLFAAVGALAGALAVCAIAAAGAIFNDTIRNEDDVARYLQLSVLASVPEREDGSGEDKEAMLGESKQGRSRKKKRKA